MISQKISHKGSISHSLDHHFRRHHIRPPWNHGLLNFSQRFTPASALFSSGRSTTAGVRGQNSSTDSYEITQKSTTFRSQRTHSLHLFLGLLIPRVLQPKFITHMSERETRHLLRKCTTEQAFTHSEEKRARVRVSPIRSRLSAFPFVIAVRVRIRLTERHFSLSFLPFFLGWCWRSRTNVYYCSGPVQSDVLCCCEALTDWFGANEPTTIQPNGESLTPTEHTFPNSARTL